MVEGSKNLRILGSKNLKVKVEETKLPNMEKFITVKASHTFIASNSDVIKETVEFLKNKSKLSNLSMQ